MRTRFFLIFLCLVFSLVWPCTYGSRIKCAKLLQSKQYSQSPDQIPAREKPQELFRYRRNLPQPRIAPRVAGPWRQ